MDGQGDKLAPPLTVGGNIKPLNSCKNVLTDNKMTKSQQFVVT